MKTAVLLKLAALFVLLAALLTATLATYADGPDDKNLILDESHPPVSNAGSPAVKAVPLDAIAADSFYIGANAVAPGDQGPEHETLRVGHDLGADTIIGTDDRIRIGSTTTYPWSAIAHLNITLANGRATACTGFFIGPRAVATAGHCVYAHDGGGLARSVEVIPGRNAAARPFGSQMAVQFHSPRGWTVNGDARDDYGVLILPNDTLSRRVGYFGFTALTDTQLDGMVSNLSGYPGDKPLGTQWFSAGRLLTIEPRWVYYNTDMTGGESGAPVWRYLNNQRLVVAINTTELRTENAGVRITRPVFDNLYAWSR